MGECRIAMEPWRMASQPGSPRRGRSEDRDGQRVRAELARGRSASTSTATSVQPAASTSARSTAISVSDSITCTTVVPLATIGVAYVMSPKDDLRPVCPNCHAMLHRRSPSFSVEELKAKLNKMKATASASATAV